MRKIICIIASSLIAAFLVTGCGGKTPTQSGSSSGAKPTLGTPTAADPGKNTPTQKPAENTPTQKPAGNTPGGIYKEAGMELKDFYSALDDGMGVFERAVNTFESDDYTLDVRGDFIAIIEDIVSLSQYDYTQSGDNPHEEGKLGKFAAVRDKKGDEITFSRSMTNENDGFSPDDKKGDIISESGSLNTSTNTMTLEYKIERDGEVISRRATEVVMLKDGTFIAQSVCKPKKPTDNRIKDQGEARFVRFNKDQLEIIMANFEPDVNFTYNSIAGKTDVSPESMAEGYMKVRQLIVKDGKVETKKY